MSESSTPNDAPLPARVVHEADESSAADAPAPPQAPQFDPRPLAPGSEIVQAQVAGNRFTGRFSTELAAESHRRMVGAAHAQPRQRRIALPVMLFVVTCISTFWAGCAPEAPQLIFGWISGATVESEIRAHWQNGLIYMACVLAILFTHEMGHFLMTLRYRIAASLPYFLPVPITPIGTMGAVISMDGLSANRRQIFDIGIAGPLAGLVVALPITWYGVTQLNLKHYQPAHTMTAPVGFGYHMPWAIEKMIHERQPEGYDESIAYEDLTTFKMNPFLMAGWVGLLITGLNMMPISQLDGGHVIYALFGKHAHTIARICLFAAILLVALYFSRAYMWTVMIVLVTLMGTDHPPTADDSASLGPVRTMLGLASLSIPFLCFPYFGLWPLNM